MQSDLRRRGAVAQHVGVFAPGSVVARPLAIQRALKTASTGTSSGPDPARRGHRDDDSSPARQDVGMNTGEPMRVQLPRPLRAELHRLSLYEKTSTVEVTFPSGVFCLAGANGLGKSTFLATVNYAITGTVPEPGREFRGVTDYYSKVRSYSAGYFRGRVNDEDAEAAYVQVELLAGGNRYTVRRGMFSPQELEALSVVDAATGEIVIADDEEMAARARQDAYARQITADCGLESFAQLAFLQHFVLTFDERRDLLFWGQRTLPAALFMAFGLDPAKARRADVLQETVRGADSLARNYSWQASDWRRQLENLETAAEAVVAEDKGAVAAHKALQEEEAEAATEAERVAGELADTQLRISERSAQLRADRQRFDQLWGERLQGHGHPSGHPVVTISLGAGRCALCGTAGEDVREEISRSLAAGHCPLCASPLNGADGAQDDRVAALRDLDERIKGHQHAIEAAGRTAEALTAQLAAVRERLDAAARSLNEFERANEVALIRTGDELDVVAERYRASMADQLQRKEEQLRRRNEARAELRTLQRELVQSYGVARDRFVPNFTRLAEQFLGLRLDVDLEARSNDVVLNLTVQGDRRRAEDQLSESQRFFLDIALRMALVGEMSSELAPGVLYVDTPEGSLDIAYEARAGDMFGSFARDGFGLIMTANINTSKLLERLAERCGRNLMTLERMTEWTTLSEVQSDEEALFDEAYREIESALEHAE